MQRPGRGLSSHVFVCARLAVAPARARAGGASRAPGGQAASESGGRPSRALPPTAELRAECGDEHRSEQCGGEQDPPHTAMPIWVDELTPEIISDANVPARMALTTDTVGPAASRALRTASGVSVPSATSARTRAGTRMWQPGGGRSYRLIRSLLLRSVLAPLFLLLVGRGSVSRPGSAPPSSYFRTSAASRACP